MASLRALKDNENGVKRFSITLSNEAVLMAQKIGAARGYGKNKWRFILEDAIRSYFGALRLEEKAEIKTTVRRQSSVVTPKVRKVVVNARRSFEAEKEKHLG